MSVTNTKGCSNAAGALLYQVYGLGKQGRENMQAGRVRAAAFRSDFGADPNKAIHAQIRAARAVRRKGRTNEAITLIQSWSPEELDKNNPEHVQRANDLGYELAQRLHPQSLVSVVTHTDSKGGNVHNHITVLNDCLDTGKSIQQNKLPRQVRAVNDELMKEQGLRTVEPQAVAVSQLAYWGARRTKDTEEEIRALEEHTELSDKDRERIAQLNARLARLADKPKLQEWDEQLQELLEESLLDPRAVDIESYADVISEYGVSVNLRRHKKTQRINSITFQWEDWNGKQRKRTGSKLGQQYTVEGLEAFFDKREKGLSDVGYGQVEATTGATTAAEPEVRVFSIPSTSTAEDDEPVGGISELTGSSSGEPDQSANGYQSVIADLSELSGDATRAVHERHEADEREQRERVERNQRLFDEQQAADAARRAKHQSDGRTSNNDSQQNSEPDEQPDF